MLSLQWNERSYKIYTAPWSSIFHRILTNYCVTKCQWILLFHTDIHWHTTLFAAYNFAWNFHHNQYFYLAKSISFSGGWSLTNDYLFEIFHFASRLAKQHPRNLCKNLAKNRNNYCQVQIIHTWKLLIKTVQAWKKILTVILIISEE